jgi:preprotein translocase subunit SecE
MNRLIAYLRQSRNELTKVVWPSRQTTIRYTAAVLGFSIVLAIFIGGIDYLFTQVIQKVILKG